MKCFSLKIMEQTHLISVCVFCILCATHIHCSEYSSRAVKSKIKSKGDNPSLDKFDRGPSLIGASVGGRKARSVGPGPLYSSYWGRGFGVTEGEQEFLNSTQRPRGPGTTGVVRGGGAAGAGDSGPDASDSNGGIAPSRNSIQSVNKYIKIPETVGIVRVESVAGVARRSTGREDRRMDRRKRESGAGYTPVLDEQFYVESLFKKYRNSENKIDLNGFKTMLRHLGLDRFAMVGRGANRGGGDDEEERPLEEEHINSLELRGGGGQPEKDHSLQGNVTLLECISPRSLLKTIARETFAMDAGNGTEKRTDLESTEAKDGGNSVSLATTDLYLSKSGLLKLSPFLLYQLVEPQPCHSGHHHHHGEEEMMSENHHLLAWLYASASVVIVSLCGLLGVFVIPIMGHAFYQQLLQFLVALAVGTLCGDALLHLLPHAIIPHNDDAHEDEPHDHDHTSTMWKGLAVLLGIVFFFFTEKCLTLASEWRKKHQRNKKVQGHSHVQILNGNNESESVGEKLCKHKYSSYPYCYPDIKSNKDGHEHSRKHAKEPKRNNSDDRDLKAVLVPKWGNDAKDGENQRLTHVPEQEQRDDEKQCAIDEDHVRDEKNNDNEVSCGRKDGEYTVIIREHETIHHGHSHAHGHVHSPPESLSSVAWMVILGDGLHNFTDGMAIGAAFANNIAGGFSTAVAVFCHELPHELGDFAVLIKAGMSAKKAVFYNLISSILCFFGMCLGIFVGDNPQATSWVFAVSAGMFLYIGLVDMFPELTSSHSAIESSFCQCSLQGLGLISGVSIMLIIAFYEDQLLTLFN